MTCVYIIIVIEKQSDSREIFEEHKKSDKSEVEGREREREREGGGGRWREREKESEMLDINNNIILIIHI